MAIAVETKLSSTLPMRATTNLGERNKEKKQRLQTKYMNDNNKNGCKWIATLKNLFGVRKEERLLMGGILLLLVILHALLIYKYYGLFTKIDERGFYWTLFIRNFHVSGFDPITYSIVSKWSAGYNVYRHPLLAFFMYVPYLLNQGLMWLTGINCAIFIVAAMQTFWAFYALLFFYRIIREVIGLTRGMSSLFTIFFLSFAYIMVSAIVPDHFIISMMLLLMTLYITGMKMRKGSKFTMLQNIILFVVTAGVSLNNGLKVYLASLFANGKKFFRPLNIILAVLLPAALMWGFCRWEYATFVWPNEVKKHEIQKKRKEAQKKKAYEMKIAQAKQDSIMRAKGDTSAIVARQAAQATATQKKAEQKKKRAQKQGAPISNGEFLRWTDVTSSRLSSTVENLFGESIQMHQDYLLGDVLRSRPMIVHYRWWWSYTIEAIIAALFVGGIIVGRKRKYLWLVLSFFGMDMALHIGLGFGINEVYIMSAHYMYAIPIAIACIVPSAGARVRRALTVVLSLITVYLLIYNVSLLASYFLQ